MLTDQYEKPIGTSKKESSTEDLQDRFRKLMNPAADKYTRPQKRYFEKLTDHLNKYVVPQVEKYFHFISTNTAPAVQEKTLTEYNELFLSWLLGNKDKFIYDECKDYFLSKVNAMYTLLNAQKK